MSFSDDLFSALKGSTTAGDLARAMEKLRSADPSTVKEAASRCLTLLGNYSGELSQRNEHKKASFQFYQGARIVREFFGDKTVENEWLLRAAEGLALGSKEYVVWSDYEGAAVCVVVSSLLRYLADDWTPHAHLEEFTSSPVAFSPNAQAIVRIPTDLLTAVEQGNIPLLEQIEGNVSRLLIQNKISNPYFEGINETMINAREKTREKLKFPKIVAQMKYPKDLVFGEPFEVLIEINNRGKGPATKTKLNVRIPDDLGILEGSSEANISTLEPEQEFESKLKLICSTGEGRTEIEPEINLHLVYEDVIGARKTLDLGPYRLSIKAYRESERILGELEKLDNEVRPQIDHLNEIASLEIIKPFAQEFTKHYEAHIQETRTSVEREEFQVASAHIEMAKNLSKSVASSATKIIKEYKELRKKSSEESENLKNEIESLIETLDGVRDTVAGFDFEEEN